GKSLTQQLTVKMDPRVTTSPTDLAQQFNLSLQAYRGMNRTFETVNEIKKLRAQLKDLINRVGRGPLAEALNNLDKKAAAIAGEGRVDGPGGGIIDVREPNLTRLNGGFASLLDNLQDADLAPTQPMLSASFELQTVLTKLWADWENLKSKEITDINASLRAANQPPLSF
ncbi:MAG TPA: hypothetical protein VFI71_14135, partial [Pyrinomonadaceae bacterium]|nr:hypothetical protein [Pyrinomonadaceae bacterium]